MYVGHRVTTLLALLLIFGSSDLASAKKFVWKFERGEQYKFDLTQNIRQSMATPQGPVKVSMEMSLQARWKVNDKDSEGNVVLEQSFEQMKMKMAAPGQQIVVDSADESTFNSAAGRLFGQMIKQAKRIKIIRKLTPRGKVLETKAEVPDDLGGVPLPGFSPDDLKEMAKESFLAFPDKDLRPGDSWSDSVTLALPQVGKVTVTTKYTYTGETEVDGRKLDRFDGVVTFGDSKAGDAPSPNFKGTGTLVTYFDAAAGRMVSTEGKQELEVESVILGQTTKAKIKIELKSRLTPVEAASTSNR